MKAYGCVDCGSSHDYYVVADDTWEAAALDPDAFCCLPCLERRLGRPLTIGDFTLAPVNRLAYAGAGKLAVLIEAEQRRKQQDKQLKAFLRGKPPMRIFLDGEPCLTPVTPASVIVSASGTVHIVAYTTRSGRIIAACGFSRYEDEALFEPARDCAFCQKEACR
jgi:hypothetical protein